MIKNVDIERLEKWIKTLFEMYKSYFIYEEDNVIYYNFSAPYHIYFDEYNGVMVNDKKTLDKIKQLQATMLDTVKLDKADLDRAMDIALDTILNADDEMTPTVWFYTVKENFTPYEIAKSFGWTDKYDRLFEIKYAEFKDKVKSMTNVNVIEESFNSSKLFIREN